MTQHEMPQLDPRQQELLQRKVAQMENGDQTFTEESTPLDSYNPQPAMQPTMQPATPLTTETVIQQQDPVRTETAVDLKQKIAELEEFLGDTPGDTGVVDKTFRDSNGDETYYVRNVSGMHVVLSDLEIEKIPVGKSIDLLKFTNLDTLKQSRDLRRCVNAFGSEKTLKRITQQEYAQDKAREAANKKKLDALQRQEQLRAQTQQSNTELLPHERNLVTQP